MDAVETAFEKNCFYFNGKKIFFPVAVHSHIVFRGCHTVLLIGDTIPDNNIYIIDRSGENITNISQIVDLPSHEAYVSIGKADNNTLAVVSYNGVAYFIDVEKKVVLRQEILK